MISSQTRPVKQEIITSSPDAYRLLFERAPVALYRTAPDGSVLDVNDALIRLLAYPDRETFLNVNAADVYLDPGEREIWRAQLERGDTAAYEMRDRRFDGSIIWVRDVARAVRDENGELLWFEGMLEQTGRSVEDESLSQLAVATGEAIWSWDAASGQVLWNGGLRATFGYQAETVGLGIENWYAWWTRHIHPDDVVNVVGRLRDLLTTGASAWRHEYRFRLLDGRYVSVFDRGYIARNVDGQPVKMMGSLVDRTNTLTRAIGASRARGAQLTIPRTGDKLLMTWIARGDARALDELRARFGSVLLMVASTLLDSQEDAEEVVADTFVRVWTAANTYSSERGAVGAWLTTLCRSRALELLRKRRRRAHLLADVLVDADHTDGIDAGVILNKAIITEAVDSLSEVQRECIELAFFAGLSHADIADRLGEPLGTVKTRIRSGLSTLRRRITEAA